MANNAADKVLEAADSAKAKNCKMLLAKKNINSAVKKVTDAATLLKIKQVMQKTKSQILLVKKELTTLKIYSMMPLILQRIKHLKLLIK